MSNSKQQRLEAFGKLMEVVEELREKCPWDRKQTNESLRTNTIEEVYELSNALQADDIDDIRKELGDVLLHVLFYSKIADVKADDAHTVEQNWEQIKLKEKNGNKSVLDGVPKALPSLIKAERIQEKVANYGFDWEKKEDVWAKVKEELSEFEHELLSGEDADRSAEFGDLLFSLVNVARLYKINADNALEHTNRKFVSRFNHIETAARERGADLRKMTLPEMDALWNEAKLSEQK